MGQQPLPWSEVGVEAGRSLVTTSDDLSLKLAEALAGVSGPGIPDFSGSRWRYEFCIFRMFWFWYVGNSPKVTKAGGAKPLLDALHRASHEAMVRAGLLPNDEDSLRGWENDLEKRFLAYKAAYEQVHMRPDFPLRATGRDSVGWVLGRYLFPRTEPDFRFVLLVNELGSSSFTGLAKMFTRLEARSRKKSWWKFWQ